MAYYPTDKGFIICDTEGTGLFRHHNIVDGEKVTARSDEPGQPRMAEFAAVLCNRELEVESTYQAYIQPFGWLNADSSVMQEMPAEAFAIHGLSFEFLREKGVPVELALAVYTKAIKEGRILIGFNQQHDGRQIRAELRHAGLDDLFEVTPNICAMRSLQAAKIKVKKLNGKGGFPRLIDAAAHFDIPYPEERRHTALEDANVTQQIARRLLSNGLLLPAEVHYAKDFQGGKEGVS